MKYLDHEGIESDPDYQQGYALGNDADVRPQDRLEALGQMTGTLSDSQMALFILGWQEGVLDNWLDNVFGWLLKLDPIPMMKAIADVSRLIHNKYQKSGDDEKKAPDYGQPPSVN